MKQKLLRTSLTLLMMTVTAVITVFIMKTLYNNKVDKVDNENPIHIDSNIQDIDESQFIKDKDNDDPLSYITINGNEHLFLRNGFISASSLLCNYNANYFLSIKFIYKNEVIYQTGLIPTNKGVQELPIKRKFSEGTYDIKLIYDFYSSIGFKISTSVEVNVKLIVEN